MHPRMALPTTHGYVMGAELGLYGMGRGVTRLYDRLAKTCSDLHV